MCHLRVLPGRRCWTVPSPSGSRGEGKALPGSLLCYLWLQRTLRSRLIVCVMSLMAQGAHRGRPAATRRHHGYRAWYLARRRCACAGLQTVRPGWVGRVRRQPPPGKKISARSQCLCGGIFYARLAKLTNKLAKANKRPGAAGW